MSTSVFLFIPLFFLIVIAEWIVSYKRKDSKYTLNSTVMNVAIGAIDRLGSLFTMALLYVVLSYVYRHFALYTVSSNWYQWVLGYVAVDFVSYWFHRFSHQVNLLWAGHITHHSSTHFNLSNSFRTSIFQGINRILFWIPLPLFGFSPEILIALFTISGIYDFFMHTPYFPKNKWFEKIVITPSLHKVHHGKNDIYIDKNYGSTFSIWDRMFGTFTKETEEVKFGITDDYKDTDPLNAITYYYSRLLSSLKKRSGLKNILSVLFAHPYTKALSQPFKNPVWMRPTIFRSPLWYFTIFDLFLGIAIDFFSLVFRDRLVNWEFGMFYLVGLGAIVAAVRVLNRSLSLEAWKKRRVYYLCGCIFFLAATSIFHNIFFFWLSVYFLFILILLVLIPFPGEQKIFPLGFSFFLRRK
jgi:sterol desaturase/sphingolipid hydroxylase (fatty acid hydroxylase superfamily)